MKKILFLCCLLSIAYAGKAQYQRESGFLLGINAGYTYPLGDFGKINKNGLGGNLSAKYLINNVIGLGFEAGYHSFKNDITGRNEVTQDYKCTLIPLVVETTFYIPTWDRSILPYFGLHFGAYMTSIKINKSADIYNQQKDVSKKITHVSPGIGPDIGVLIELSEYIKLDIKVKGDYVYNIKDTYDIDEYTQGNIGFKKMMNLGASIGFLYTFR